MNKSDLLRELRSLTQAGMKDCLDALNEAGEDLQKAVDIIKTKGKNIVSSRQGKVASEGVIAYCSNIEGNLSCLVEVNCQTDFVAKSKDFGEFAADVALSLYDCVSDNQVFNPAENTVIQSTLEQLVATTKENIVIRRWSAEQALTSLARVFHYVHSNSQIGVLLTLLAPSVEARNDPAFIELGNDLAMQVAAMNPLAISSDQIPDEEMQRQMVIFLDQIRELNKPEAAQAKILTGKCEKWFAEVCLTNQESVVVPKTQVRQVVRSVGEKLGGEIKIVNMIRCQVGEGIQQQSANLADEVAKLMQ